MELMRPKTESWLQFLVVVFGIVAMVAAFVVSTDQPIFSGEYLLVGVAVFLLLLEVPLAIWVYRDAEHRGVDEPIRFAAAVLVPVLGLLVFGAYLSLRQQFAGEN